MSKKSTSSFNVYVVEDHNNALDCIYQEIGSRRLKFSELTMIHFDSHPDLGIPQNLKASEVFNKSLLLDSLSIENWILPAVYAGHFSKIVWIKPKWSDQIDCGVYNITIGQESASGLIKCDCKESYFLSDGLYTNESNLTNKRRFELYVCDFEASVFDDLLSDMSVRGDIVLDIDLDFFSTMDPFREMLKHNYDLFRYVYYEKIQFSPKDPEFDAKYEAYCKNKSVKLEQIKDLLSKTDSIENEDCDVRIKKLYKAIRSDNLDVEIVHEYGSVLDQVDLPHHVACESELVKYIDLFQVFVEKYLSKCRPSVVTIARSSTDGYCPLDQVDSIQERVLFKLEQFFNKSIGKININL